ncbi:MAG: hypothetical protein HYR97_06645 [Candidatus Melainabacteria bacterium]|nr:hypothetical protein [Candidatus Melainabacteria bacterium]MBI3307802.1 hypothetical protein [Candidatus Melainabacteria bacterium]
MKKAKKTTKKINKKILMAAIALSIGTQAQAAVKSIDNDSLFGLNEVNSYTHLIAHEDGSCGEGKCGEGKCGEGKEAATKAKEAEANCGITKWFRSLFGGKKQETTSTVAKDEAKCGEDKCGEGSCG